MQIISIPLSVLQKIYLFLQQPEPYDGIPKFLHLLLCYMCKRSYQSVFESMGCILDRRARGRSAGSATLHKESSLLAGPTINETCKLSIEEAWEVHLNSWKKWNFFRTIDRAEKLKLHWISETFSQQWVKSYGMADYHRGRILFRRTTAKGRMIQRRTTASAS